jgi:NhaA family Na+:H+ antiporter
VKGGNADIHGERVSTSIFITLLAFPTDPAAQAQAKIGILAGSLLSGLAGYTLLRLARSDWPPTPSR